MKKLIQKIKSLFNKEDEITYWLEQMKEIHKIQQEAQEDILNLHKFINNEKKKISKPYADSFLRDAD